MFKTSTGFTSNRQAITHDVRTSTNRVGEQLGEKTTAGAIDGVCEFTQQMLPNLERAMDHSDMTEELAEILSTKLIRLEYRVETDIWINDE